MLKKGDKIQWKKFTGTLERDVYFDEVDGINKVQVRFDESFGKRQLRVPASEVTLIEAAPAKVAPEQPRVISTERLAELAEMFEVGIVETVPAPQEMHVATYYAAPLWSENVYELDRDLIEEFVIDVPQHEGGDANNPVIRMWNVTVVAPKGYGLTDKDHARIDELIHIDE